VVVVSLFSLTCVLTFIVCGVRKCRSRPKFEEVGDNFEFERYNEASERLEGSYQKIEEAGGGKEGRGEREEGGKGDAGNPFLPRSSESGLRLGKKKAGGKLVDVEHHKAPGSEKSEVPNSPLLFSPRSVSYYGSMGTFGILLLHPLPPLHPPILSTLSVLPPSALSFFPSPSFLPRHPPACSA
jgi:hypothetical protein